VKRRSRRKEKRSTEEGTRSRRKGQGVEGRDKE